MTPILVVRTRRTERLPRRLRGLIEEGTVSAPTHAIYLSAPEPPKSSRLSKRSSIVASGGFEKLGQTWCGTLPSPAALGRTVVVVGVRRMESLWLVRYTSVLWRIYREKSDDCTVCDRARPAAFRSRVGARSSARRSNSPAVRTMSPSRGSSPSIRASSSASKPRSSR
jgi:hypothetical protein